VYVLVCMYVCTYVYICRYVYVCMCIYVGMYMYVCMYVCVCVYIYIYTHINKTTGSRVYNSPNLNHKVKSCFFFPKLFSVFYFILKG